MKEDGKKSRKEGRKAEEGRTMKEDRKDGRTEDRKDGRKEDAGRWKAWKMERKEDGKKGGNEGR